MSDKQEWLTVCCKKETKMIIIKTIQKELNYLYKIEQMLTKSKWQSAPHQRFLSALASNTVDKHSEL